MKIPGNTFQNIILGLLVIIFLALSVSFYVTRPIAILVLLPDLIILCCVIAAAYAVGSYIMEQLLIDEISPTEDFVFATSIGLAIISLLTILLTISGFLNWWSASIMIVLLIVVGFNRIIGLLSPPTYLFGPEDLAEEGPSALSWMQFIALAIWVIFLFHFCLLPPVIPESLSSPLGMANQWILGREIVTGAGAEMGLNLTSGLFTLALVLKGANLAMMMSALFAGLVLTAIYCCVKRYCGPLAGRSALLISASLPVFCYYLLSPGDILSMALFQFLAFFTLMRWFDEKKRRWAVLSGIFAGVSIAASSLSFIFAVPLLLSALIWATTNKEAKKFLFHLLIGSGAAVLAVLPWFAVHLYLFNDFFSMLLPLGQLHIPSWQEAFHEIVSLPQYLAFPVGTRNTWDFVGPLYLVFIPFYFVTVRKNPMTGMATTIGLITVFGGRILGMSLGHRLISLLLLAIPVSMAGHRLMEVPWKRRITLGILYTLVFWHAFHSMALVEGTLDVPHRRLLGLETEEQYLSRSIDYYDAAIEINNSVAFDARIIAPGLSGNLYFERITVIPEGELLEDTLAWLSNSQRLAKGLSRLVNRGYSHILMRKGAFPQKEEIIFNNLKQYKLFEKNGYFCYSIPADPLNKNREF